MDTLAWIGLGFLAVSVGVAALARSTTARWEREARAASLRRPGADAAPVHPSRLAVRLGRALGGAAVTARPVTGPVRLLLRTTGRRLGALRQRVGEAAARSPAPVARGRRRSAARLRSQPAPAVPRRARPFPAWAVHRPARSRARQPSGERAGPAS